MHDLDIQNPALFFRQIGLEPVEHFQRSQNFKQRLVAGRLFRQHLFQTMQRRAYSRLLVLRSDNSSRMASLLTYLGIFVEYSKISPNSQIYLSIPSWFSL